MTERRDPMSERTADLLDVHVLDIAAQLEALLRGVRDVQRLALQLRGVLPRGTTMGDEIQARLAAMLLECDALRDAIDSARVTAAKGAGPQER